MMVLRMMGMMVLRYDVLQRCCNDVGLCGMCVALDTQTPGRVAYCPLLRGCLVCPRFLLSGRGPENSGIFRSGKQVPPRLQGGFEITSLLIVTKNVNQPNAELATLGSQPGRLREELSP